MFHELRNGVVRLDPDTARSLAQWILPQVRRPASVAVAAFGARLRRLGLPYRLEVRTGTDRRDRRAVSDFGACAHCGTRLTRTGRQYCSRQCTLAKLTETDPPWKRGQAVLAQRRAQGQDPGHGGEAARKRGEKIAQSNRKRAKYTTADEKRLATNARAARYRSKNVHGSRTTHESSAGIEPIMILIVSRRSAPSRSQGIVTAETARIPRNQFGKPLAVKTRRQPTVHIFGSW